MSKATRIKQFIRITVISVLTLYFGLIALISLPAVQHRISTYAARELSRLTQSEVRIGNVDLGLLNRVVIQNVQIKDRQGKDMLGISRFSVKLDIPALFQKKIRIHSIQLFGLDARLRRTTPDAPLNCQFLIDTFASKDTTKKENNLDLRINSILIRRGQVHYDVLSEPVTPRKFNFHHIGIRELSATISLKTFQKDSLNAQIRRMSFNEQSGFRLKRFMLKATANPKGIYLHELTLNLPSTSLCIDTLSASGDVTSPHFLSEEETTYLGRLHASVTPADLSAFVPALEHFQDSLHMDLDFHGRGQQLRCTRFYLSSPQKELEVHAEGMIDHSSPSMPPYFFGKITQADISEKAFPWLFHNLKGNSIAVPDLIQRLGFLSFQGDVSGYPSQITAHGTLQSRPGLLNANMTMHTDTLTQQRTYSGRVSSTDFELGKLLAKDEIGKTSFDLELNGLQYRNHQPESHVKGVISSLVYNHYEYQHITLNGDYKPGGFNGHLGLDDENGQITIDGSFVTRQAVPDFNLRMKVRNFRPHKLHLTKEYKDTDVALNLTADFSGHSIDDIQGKINLDSLSVRSADPLQDYFLPRFQIHATQLASNSGGKEIRIDSPFLTGVVQGEYAYHTLLKSIERVIQKHIPSLFPDEKKTQKKKTQELNNRFRFQFRMENSEFLAKVMHIPFELQMPATLSGYLNDSLSQMRINGSLPQFTYNGKYYESGTLLCETHADELQCQLRAGTLMKKGAMFNLSFLTRAKNDKLHTTLYWGNNTSQTYSGKIDAIASFSQDNLRKALHTHVDIQPSQVILNDTTWHIHPAIVDIAKDSIEIHNFLFEHRDQYLKINGRLGKTEADSCLVDLKNINLLYIMDMIQFHAVRFDGGITGKARLLHVLKEPVMEARLDVKDFSLNQALLGRADILASWDQELGGVRLNADIRRDSTCTTGVTGYVSPKLKGLDLHIQAGGTPLAFLQPFVENIFTNVQGEAYGDVHLFGPFAELDLEGNVRARMKTKINILNTSFIASADSVQISSGLFRFQDVRLQDLEGHTGVVNGELRHTKLKNLSYNFRFQTDRMRVYDTDRATPDFPFYGHIYATGDVRLQGGDGQLNVDGQVRADNQTEFVYVLGTAAEATNSGFVTFVDRTPRRQQAAVKAEVYHPLNQPDQEDEEDTPTAIHLNLQIEPAERANMKIIMDPVAGDYISAYGTGNLRINFFNQGNFQIFGNYNITEGIYKMSMQNVIRKDFTLQPGGIVSFNGDPRAANLNVQAVYTVNSASLNDLIADASSSRGNVKVNCLLNLTGNLTSPNLSFGLELPTVSEEDRELVRSLTSTEEQMNTQIIYLLGVGKFYTYDYANNTGQTDATSSLAFSTLSGQLNNMLSQVIDNQNWNVGTNLTTGEKGWSDVEAEAILSGRLLNNRLIINGNFGYRENTLRNTNFVGDFEAIWLLTKNGEFRLRGYNETNDRYFTKSTLTTQGIGIMYKKDFMNWKELVDWFLRRRKSRSSKQKKEDDEKYIQKDADLPAAQKKRTSNEKQ
ncbi:translocation/assembly module TamB domain-containing protein [Bacteroides mediterraneensis]|uniref:translocation/assembly module TamB domain-containing protein n=1 Tax=Bacteroides mediterraneensis TaxID=1841856 RepID=UPI0026EAA84B|nr:translocation/assembly module TamB domain-containing protein [Bacteroides mediterraneensis]